MYADPRASEEQNLSTLLWLFGASVLLHFLVLIVAFSGMFGHFWGKPVAVKPQTVKLKLIDPPQAQKTRQAKVGGFVDTAQSVRTDIKQPTPYEGAETTLAKSTMAPSGVDSAVPSLEGTDKTQMDLKDQEFSDGNAERQNSPPPTAPSQERTATPQRAEVAEQTARPIEDNLPFRTNGLISKPDTSSLPAPDTTVRQEQSQSIPSASFSAPRQTSTIRGGADVADFSSIGANQSSMGKLKDKIYTYIGGRWHPAIRRTETYLPAGNVRYRFYVHSDGSISEISCTDTSSSENNTLKLISVQSIMSLSNADMKSVISKLYADDIRAQYGEAFPMDVSFSLY